MPFYWDASKGQLLLEVSRFGEDLLYGAERLISPLDTPRLYNHNNVFSPIDLDRPDFNRYPLFRGVKVLDVVVEPGETMFLPLAWWHQVVSLDVSLSFSYTNLAAPNEFAYQNPEILNW